MSKYTEKQAQVASEALWNVMASYGYDYKNTAISNHPELLGSIESDLNKCPACQYTKDVSDVTKEELAAGAKLDCSWCPLWGDTPEKHCSGGASLFYDWCVSKPEDRSKHAKLILDEVIEWGKRL